MEIKGITPWTGPEDEIVPEVEEDSFNPDKAWGKIYELANVPAGGPNNREERRRVEKVLRRLEKRGLTIS